MPRRWNWPLWPNRRFFDRAQREPAASLMVQQKLFSTTLDIGMVILGEELPGVESVSVSFHVPAGAVHDPAGGSGLATLAGEMMLRGAGARTSRRVVDDLEHAGVQWSQGVSMTHASFSGSMVARRLPDVLPIYADILQRPRLDAEELEKARQVVLQNLAGLEDDPAHRTIAAFRRLAYPTPWGHPAEGDSADVERLTIDAVRSFVGKRAVPRGTITSIAGRLEWEDFVRRIENLFAGWESSLPPSVVTGNRGPRVQHLPHDSQQTHIALGWPLPPYRDDASYEATAALAILGGGTSSRLFTEVRERRGLCYSVSAGYHTLRDFGSAVCYAGTTAARAQETLDVMLAEIARLPGSIEQAELDRVKARAKSGLVMQQESTASRAGSNARQWHHLGRILPLEEELRRIEAISVDAIERCLASHPAADVTIVSLGSEPLEVPDAVSA